MKIAAITHFKHGNIYAALKRLGWSQSELARRAEMQPTVIGRIINLLDRPTESQANKIQNALGSAGEYLDVYSEWPDSFAGLSKRPKVEQIEEIPTERLIDCPEVLQIAAPDDSDKQALVERAMECLDELSERDRAVIDDRIFKNQTLEQAGKRFGVSRERVRQIESKAIRNLRKKMEFRELVEGTVAAQ